MKKLLASLLVSYVMLVSQVQAAPANAVKPAHHFTFDKSHTSILFFIDHLGFSQMVGQFKEYDGGFTFDENHPTQARAEVTIKPQSIRTVSEKLDEELQGEKWFNSTKFPDMRFVTKDVKLTGKHTADVTGDLTLLGVTKPVIFHTIFHRTGYHPMTHDFVAGFTAEGTLKRSDFGMDEYVSMIGDEVRFIINVEGVDASKKQPTPPLIKH